MVQTQKKNNDHETPAVPPSKKEPRTDDDDGAPLTKKAKKAKAKASVAAQPQSTPDERKQALLARDSVDTSDLPPLEETAGELVSPIVSPRRSGFGHLDVAAVMRLMVDENTRSVRLTLDANAAQSRVLAEDNIKTARDMVNENVARTQEFMIASLDRIALLPTPTAVPAPVHEVHGGAAESASGRPQAMAAPVFGQEAATRPVLEPWAPGHPVVVAAAPVPIQEPAQVPVVSVLVQDQRAPAPVVVPAMPPKVRGKAVQLVPGEYLSYRTSLRMVLELNGLLPLVSGALKAPDATLDPAGYAHFAAYDAAARVLIVNSLDDETRREVADYVTAAPRYAYINAKFAEAPAVLES
ncbi:hypothetical protein SPRG_08308 [Saprolegnia parasitica CBS 223.65]|uniref:Uncharacterized protein n=1 Tax=Saprolegnia parasitica (strain CBS 223.65) TaxID=695850 RepID=A0A067C6Y0_SAPPC|nr:hypothetical protein SPRG_08308 [Saprolegnia parasitica CBS 223.65]KDO26233.1 hypothetical protein SPRG_08308 [Saprolegnia parasitica CBS 223.65]|eukprot:XP_012202942.1 hypothetical protein SPRG_08308 [Saprolegnia parasitica CBS 223.65]